MRIEIREHPGEADGWRSVVFVGAPGEADDASHVWLVPRPDGTWRLQFMVDMTCHKATIQSRLHDAVDAGFTVYDQGTLNRVIATPTDSRDAVDRAVEDLVAHPGPYSFSFSRRFSTWAEAWRWVHHNATRLYHLSRDTVEADEIIPNWRI